jgi:hypothetical protein
LIETGGFDSYSFAHIEGRCLSEQTLQSLVFQAFEYEPRSILLACPQADLKPLVLFQLLREKGQYLQEAGLLLRWRCTK